MCERPFCDIQSESRLTASRKKKRFMKRAHTDRGEQVGHVHLLRAQRVHIRDDTVLQAACDHLVSPSRTLQESSLRCIASYSS